ncbi:hypothetical protein LPJ56_005222 [Coemansia sp. RSA 2599]|nr:hypothetical protein LPJ75_004767 [Coemansia sp. RSA 2598]KAJ1813261.1 hypothetical protein LPJ56_005222 [Coemansia sp. RSA 2599]
MTNDKEQQPEQIQALQQELRLLVSKLDAKSQNPAGDSTKDALEDILKTERFVDSLESKLDDLLSRLDTLLESQEAKETQQQTP